LLLVGLLIGLVACSEEEKKTEPEVTVQVAQVASTTLEHTITADAVLFPLAQAAIVPKVSAPVQKFYVKRGSRVHQGELLATLENRDLSAAAEQNKGDYEQAQASYQTTTEAALPADLQKAQLDVDGASKLLDAQQKIYDSRQSLFQQGALPRKELDQAGVDLTNARNQYEIAKKHLDAMLAIEKNTTLRSAAGQLESAKGKYLQAAAQLSYTEIRSPINGVVTDRPLYAGEMASSGAPLITVMDTMQVIARAHIPQVEAVHLSLNDSATILVPGDEKGVEGKVTVVSPALDPNSTTVEVWVQAKNPKQSLRPGSSVRLSIVTERIPNATVIAPEALQTADDGTTTVMVAGDDSKAHQIPVKVGIREGNEVQIIQGLQPGQKVVTVGAYGLPDGAKIKIEQPGAQSSPEKPQPEKKKSDEDEK
jgi:multidrug efflux pump subunit AcrA (membrane-fusion protein)